MVRFYRAPKLMARPAGLPCPSCEGMRSSVQAGAPLVCMCGAQLRVIETREDPEHSLAPVIWRLRICSADHQLATAQFLVSGPEPQRPGERYHQCADCGHEYSSLERQVDTREAQERLAHLARERYMLARAGRRFTHPRGPAAAAF